MLKRQLLKSFRPHVGVALICALSIALIFALTFERLRYERGQATETEIRDNNNLALAFDEHSTLTLRSVDRALSLLLVEYAGNGRRIDFQKLIKAGVLDAGGENFYGVIDERGILTQGSDKFTRVDLSDREHFKIHQQRDNQGLFIGHPLLRRVTGLWGIQMSRRIDNPDGSFGGVVYMSVNPKFFTGFAERASVGESGAITLAGLDGIALARQVGSVVTFGQDTNKGELLQLQRQNRNGNFLSSGAFEGKPRLFSYRTLSEYPLFVAVGTVEAEVLKDFYARQRTYYLVAALLSSILLVVASGVAVFLRRQERAELQYGQLFHANPNPMWMYDLDTLRFLEVNDTAVAHYGYTESEFRRMTIMDIRPPEEAPDLRETLSHRRRVGPWGTSIRKHRKKDGTLFDAEVTSHAIEFRGRPAGVVQVNDITVRSQVERALQESERKYRRIYDSLEDVYYEVTLDGTILEISPLLEVLTDGQCRREDYLGKSMLSCYADPLKRTELLDKIRAQGSVRDFEIGLIKPDKSIVPCSISARLQPGLDGKPASIVGTIRDVTERKKTETALRKSKEWDELLFESSRDALMTLSPPSWGYAAANQATLDLFGVATQQAFTGLSPRDLSPERQPDGRLSDEKAQEMIATTLREGKAFFEWTHQRLDGSAFPADVLLTRMSLAGEVFVQATVRDISERKRIERKLSEANAQFKAMVEQSIAGIYIIQNGEFAYVNPRFAELFGFDSADEVIGRDSSSLVAEKDRSTVAQNVRERTAGKLKSISYEFTGLRKDGSTFEVGVHGTRASFGGRPAVMGLLQDISEKKRAEEQIKGYVRQLETVFMSTVEMAMTLGEMRDPYTTGHERRVAEISMAIGAELEFDKHRLEGLRVAGYLHDIGKITVPAEILSKPGKLSPIEFEMIRGHAQASYDVLKGVSFPWPVAQIALQHHERMDGSGYPQGLKGDAILLDARIMAVADVVEAMASHRPYRPGLGIEKALAEIVRGRGTAYDPVVADACLGLFRDKGYTIPA